MTTRILQLRRGTNAARASVVFADGELVYATDTDELWVGDGSTAGGIGPFRRQATVDHGGLAGLGDDDHTIYVLKDGTRTMDALTVAGTVTLAGGLNQIVAAAPLLALWNTTETNADGARDAILIVAQEKADGTIFYGGILRVEHDGSGADEKGRLLLELNTGAQGTAPSEALRVVSNGDVTLQGSVTMQASKTVDGRDVGVDGTKLDTIGPLNHVGKNATQTLSTSYADVTWTRTAVVEDAGIVKQAGDIEFLIDGWSGRLLIHLDLTCQNTTASNTSGWASKIQRKPSGGSYADVPNSTRIGQVAASVGTGNDSRATTVVLVVTDGDLVKVQAKNDGGGGTVRLVTEGCCITLMRLPAP